ILFGSFAQKIVDFNSDLDLLVIMPPSRSGKEWMKLIYAEVERTISSDIIVFNCQEFNEKLPKSAFLQEIVNSGVILYEKAP
ncbi:MAG: nucleotidyltransferase domain-containing protein, partial [Candidatus Hodarchaeota archaeon]